MLQLTRQADYGIRLMLEVADHEGDRITIRGIAERQGLPYEFLRKVARSLSSHGLLAAKRGTRGGVALGRAAETISLLDIVRSCGSIGLNLCTLSPTHCERRPICPVYPVWAEAQRAVEQLLGGTLLSAMAADSRAQIQPELVLWQPGRSKPR